MREVSRLFLLLAINVLRDFYSNAFRILLQPGKGRVVLDTTTECFDMLARYGLVMLLAEHAALRL